MFKKEHKVNSGRRCSEERKKKISESLVGHYVSEETRKKMSDAKKGKLPKNLKALHSPEARAKQAKTMTGRQFSDEEKSTWKKMKPQSEEHIRHRVESRKGYTHSEETRIKIGKGNKGKKVSAEAIAKRVESMEGFKHSPETKAKISKATKGKNNPMFGMTGEKCPAFGKIRSAETIRKMLMRREPSSLEQEFLSIIDKHNLPYKFVGDGSFMVGRKNPDFININGAKIAIEVYARYYKLRHSETIKEWKEDRKKIFSEYGWEILFFDETQVNEGNVLNQLR